MSRRRSRRLFYRRTFLNRPGFHAGAHVIAEVTVRPGGWVDADLVIADCRSVVLDFSAEEDSSAGARRNAVRKARLLAQVATEFADRLDDAIEEVFGTPSAR
ncbi:MAG: hypothetical protein GC157_10290 [Frankiales bacterium]|nr:hypothetical protein [Frankiales bacterium]